MRENKLDRPIKKTKKRTQVTIAETATDQTDTKEKMGSLRLSAYIVVRYNEMKRVQ